MVFVIAVLSLLLIAVSIWFRDGLLAATFAVIPIIISAYTVAQSFYEKQLSSTKTNITVQSFGNKAIITCTLQSSHPKRLLIDKAYLFVDTGDFSGEVCKFKHILCHNYGEESCLIAKKMNQNGISTYQDINPDNPKGIFFELVHLSSATILYLDPHEEFSDECVLQLGEGVYRAMFIVTFKNADCNCATKHFFITK